MADLFYPTTIPEEPVYARPDSDFYATRESYATALLGARDFHGQPIWECACGGGHLVEVMKAMGLAVVPTDAEDTGYGTPGVDFLRTREPLAPAVVTNPPYGGDRALQFAHHAMAVLGAAECWLLCRAAWWEAPGRFRKLKALPLRHIWVVNSRESMWPFGRVPHGKEKSTWQYYHAWYGFIAGEPFDPRIDVIDPRPDLLEDRLPI